MTTESTQSKRKLLLLAGAGLLCAGVLALAVMRGVDLRGLVQQGLDLITAAGPVAFFGGMALLPLFGAPLLAFVLTAGPAFGPRYGMPAVVGLSLLAVTFNMMVAYFLARRGMRPFLSSLVMRLGYRMPEMQGGDATDLLIIMRVTPGVPFCVQNYMAGLANVPLRPYIIVSCIAVWANNTAFVLFGDALLHGKGKMVLISIGCLAALVAATHMVRRHYAARKAAQ
jgi:uncharacterized membrane protein YdjX (TVP38/TMEM64 family)